MVAVSSPSNKSVMGRESRHVYVSGLPETVTDEKINGFFSIYGRVHQIERSADGVVVSFMDVRSAQKAHAGDHRLEPGIPFRISFHEPGTKNSLMTSSSISTGGSNGTVSPKSIEMPRRRSPSPRGSKDSNRSSQLRVSSSVALKRIIRSDPYRREQGRSPEHSTSTAVACSSGLQGVYVERLPPRSDGTIKESIRDALKKHGRIVDISIEGDGDARKALVIFQRVVDMEKLVNDSHVSIHGVRVRIRAASHVVVQEAYNDYLSLNSPAGSGTVVTTDLDLPSKYAQPNGARADVDVFHPKASRTLYVGGLETRISDDTLRRRFVKYGTILDVDVKNYESPSPFAFIQFADIDSAVRAINAHAAISTPQTNKKGKKFQPNFGRSMTTNKLWIGSVPQTVSEDYVTQKLKTLSDGVIDVVVDMRLRQAIVVFSSTEAAQAALNRIKAGVPKQFVFKVESGEARVPADFCSDRLHDHFIDRKHGGNPVLSTNDESHACLLAPPPDPPSDMPSYRYDYHRDSRRSPSHSRRRERSRSRDRSRERSRHRKPSKYDYEKSSSRRKERKDRKTSASSDSSSSSSGGSTPTRLRSGSNDSRVSSPLSYSQRKERRRDERRDRDRNSNGKFRCSQPGRRSPFGTPKWSGRRSSRHSPVLDERVSHPLAEDRTAPIPDDRKSGDSGFYEDARPPLDPPPAPPPMESLPSVPSPPPADPPPMTHSRLELTRVSQCHTPQTSSGPVFVSPPSTSKQDAIIHLESPVAPIQSLRHSSISIPGTSSATTQKRSSVDGLQTRQNSQNCRSRIFKWPWGNGDVARTPVLFPEICNTRLLDPRSKSDLSCRPPILKLSPPPFALLDSTERPRPVDEWRKRSSSSTVSVDGNRRSCGGTPQRQHSSTTGIEEQRSSIRSQSSGRPIVSRSSSSGAESDPQLSPEAPLPPAPPSALDLLCEPDATPSLTDSWSGVRYRLADIGSKLTDVKSSLLEAHKSVDEIQEREPRQTSATQRTDSFEEKLRSISQKKKSSFDEFTLNITRERIQAIKASVPDGSASLSGLSSCGFTRNVTTPRPALSITIPQPSSASQSTASTPASVKIESPSSVRKPSVSLASRPPPSSPAISSSIVRISAPPTAPVIAYPPNFSVPPPTFAPMLQTPVESQPSPLLSAPPPPPQLPPATTVRRDSMSSLKSPPMTPGSCSSWKPSTPSTSSAPTSRCVVQLKEALSVLTTPKTPLSSKLPSKIEKLPARHDSVSALKSPVQTQHQTSLSGRSLSVSDTRKPVLNVPHKDPSTELLAGLFHNKPPTTDFRKLPKIEKKQCTVSNNNEKDKKSENKKDKEHRLRRKEDGTFETKEERSKRKETDRIKKEKTKLKDYKKERKVKEDRKKSKEEDKEKKDKKTKKNEKEKERERKVKKKKKSRHSSSDEDSSSDDDDHFQRAFNKQIASVNDEGGALGGYSMYDRVKRRSSAVNRDEGAKKTALQKLREKTNEKKGQKRKRVQLDWSDEDEDSRKRDSEDAETSDPEAENSKKEESMDSSDNDTEKKKQVWSSNDSEESGDNKKLKKSGKKHTKQKKASKNINMDDVFGANSSDEEKIHKEKKRKKSKKESSDENDVPKKKGRSEKLDFEAIFGSDKPDKHKKKEKSEREEKERKDKKDRDTKKRSPEDDNGKPAKRLKKEPDSDGSFCSEGEPQKIEKIDTDGEFEENTISEDKVMKIEEHSNDMTIINTATTSNETTEEIAIIPLDQSKEERPRLLTKAALKVFVPSQSSVPASTSSQPSIEADSGESDEGYDGAFPGPSHLVPLHVSSSSSCSDNDESDSDSDSRHSHPREVELVDAAAGYASVTSPEPESYRKDGVNRERIKSSESPIREFTVELKNRDHTRILPVTLIEEVGLMFPETTVSMQSNLEEPVVARQETTADDGDAEKDVRDMSDLQETEDAVQSIFDDYEEEQEPQYPSHDFIRADASGAVKTMVIDEAERAASAIEEIDNLMSKDVSDEQLEPSVEEVINDTEGKSEDEKNDSSPSSETVPMPNIGEEEIAMPIPAEVVLTPFGEQAVEQPIPSSISVSIPESNVISAATVSDPRSPLPKNSGSLETSTSTPEPISQSSVIQSKVQVASPQPRISPTGTNSYSNSSGLAQLPPASVGGLTQGLPIITQASQIQQQQYYNLLQQQPKLTAEAQLRVADVQSRVSKPQTPAATLSPAPKAATPVCQQQAVLAQAVQMQQMQQILLAGMRQDPIGYYQQISQSCGQQMAAALLSQVMQYPSTSQTQQLIDFQRQQQQQQQQYKTHQDSSVAASSPQPQHQLQERERLLIKETQMRALREREQAAVLQQHQQAIYAQMRQAFHLTQQQQQQGASQGSPAISQTSSASSSTAPVMERKSAAVPPQPRASEDRPVIQVVAPQTASSSPAIAPVVQPLPRADPEMTKVSFHAPPFISCLRGGTWMQLLVHRPVQPGTTNAVPPYSLISTLLTIHSVSLPHRSRAASLSCFQGIVSASRQGRLSTRSPCARVISNSHQRVACALCHSHTLSSTI